MSIRAAIAGVVLGAVFAPFSAVQAWGYGGCDGYFFPCGTGYGAPREQLVVYAWGPGTTAQSPYRGDPYQGYGYQPMYQPSYQYYPQPSYQPQYYPQYSYSYPQYGYGYAPQYAYGYGGQPMGTTDLFGNQLCDWGTGYRGYRCDYDPHQWILDPYTGQYY